MKIFAGFAVLLAAALVVCCGQEKKILSRTELIQYINDPGNGLKQTQEVQGIRAELRYQPSSLLVMQALGQENVADKKATDSLEKHYGKNYYFLLKFSKGGQEAIRQLGSFSRYSDMVQVFSFQMHRFVNLTTPQLDTIPLADYLFDQTYGMSDGNTILLCFDKAKLQDKDMLHINVAECGLGTGALQFSFKRKQIDRLPALDFAAKH